MRRTGERHRQDAFCDDTKMIPQSPVLSREHEGENSNKELKSQSHSSSGVFPKVKKGSDSTTN